MNIKLKRLLENIISGVLNTFLNRTLIVLHDGDLCASESVLVFNTDLVIPCENYLSGVIGSGREAGGRRAYENWVKVRRVVVCNARCKTRFQLLQENHKSCTNHKHCCCFRHQSYSQRRTKHS